MSPAELIWSIKTKRLGSKHNPNTSNLNMHAFRRRQRDRETNELTENKSDAWKEIRFGNAPRVVWWRAS